MSSKKPNNKIKDSKKPLAGPGSTLNLLGAAKTPTSRSSKLNPSNDLQRLSVSTKATTRPIQFGQPSSTGTGKNATTNSLLATLIGQSTSKQGISSLIGGNILGFGVGSLLSDIGSLFGGSGKATPPPLQRFSLPTSQEQTLYSSSGGISLTESSGSATPRSAAGTYGANSGNNQADIVKAVKNALLTSSSLNDVIGEL